MAGAVGVAILRYRLYDIDLIINRTLVYAVVTSSLGLLYAVVSLLAGVVLGRGSTWVTARSMTCRTVTRPPPVPLRWCVPVPPRRS